MQSLLQSFNSVTTWKQPYNKEVNGMAVFQENFIYKNRLSVRFGSKFAYPCPTASRQTHICSQSASDHNLEIKPLDDLRKIAVKQDLANRYAFTLYLTVF